MDAGVMATMAAAGMGATTTAGDSMMETGSAAGEVVISTIEADSAVSAAMVSTAADHTTVADPMEGDIGNCTEFHR